MRHSRREKRPVGPIWNEAADKINLMERAVVAKMVTPDKGIIITDVLDWLIPPAELRMLRDAYPYAKQTGGAIYKLFDLPNGGTQLHVNFDHIECLAPIDDIVNLQPSAPKADSLMALVNETTAIVAQYDKLTVKGDRFKELHIDHNMSELLREAPEIIARGLLCGGDKMSTRYSNLFSVRLGDGLFHTLISE